MRRHLICLSLVLLTVAVRVPHLDHGLPLILEEALPLKQAFDMWGWQEGSLQLDPATAGWPALSFYVHLAAQKLQYLLGRAAGVYSDAYDFYVAFQLDPTTTVLVGRWLGVLVSVVVVLVACRLASRLAGDIGALAAGLVLALAPLMVRHAQLITPDILLVAFAALATARIARRAERDGWRDTLWAGLWIGLGAACKYTPLMLLLPLVAVHVLRERKHGRGIGSALFRDGRPWAAVGIALAFLFLSSPFLLRDLAVLRRDVAYQLTHLGAGHFGQQDRVATWIWYLRDVLAPGLGYGALVIGTVGLGWAAWRRRGPWLALLFCLLVFYPGLALSRTAFDRYMLPALFPLAMGTAAATLWARERLAGRSGRTAQWGLTAVIAVVAAGAAVGTVAHHRDLASVPTSQLLANHLHEHAGSRLPYVALEHYTVELPERQFAWDATVMPVLDALSPEQRARLQDRVLFETVLLPLYSTYPQHSAPYYDIRWLRPYDRIVVSSAVKDRYTADPERFAAQNRFYSDLELFGTVEASFAPEPGRSRGPEITVYRLDDAAWRRVETERGPAPERWTHATTSPRHFQVFMTSVARHAFQKDDYDLASRAYAALVDRLGPEFATGVLRRRGFIELQRGRFEAARTLFEQQLVEVPEDPAALLGLGVVAQELGDPEAARNYYERVIAAEPEGTNADLARRRLDGIGRQ